MTEGVSVRYGLSRFLEVGEVTCDGQALNLYKFNHFETVVDHLLAELATIGLTDIPVEVAPYFGSLWPSGELLAIELSKRLQQTTSAPLKRTLELGCGLGLPSLVAAKAGLHVTAVDVNEDALFLIRQNFALNGLAHQLREVQADWRRLSMAEAFDLVIASDVLYEAYHPKSLAQVIAEHMSEQGEFIVVDPCRWYYQDFHTQLRAAGFKTTMMFSDTLVRGAKTRQVVIKGSRS